MPFKPGQQRPPRSGIKKGGKWGITIEKEKRREYYDEQARKKVDNWIATVRPEYGLDQWMGKSPETIDLNLKGKLVIELPPLKDVK